MGEIISGRTAVKEALNEKKVVSLQQEMVLLRKGKLPERKRLKKRMAAAAAAEEEQVGNEIRDLLRSAKDQLFFPPTPRSLFSSTLSFFVLFQCNAAAWKESSSSGRDPVKEAKKRDFFSTVRHHWNVMPRRRSCSSSSTLLTEPSILVDLEVTKRT